MKPLRRLWDSDDALPTLRVINAQTIHPSRFEGNIRWTCILSFIQARNDSFNFSFNMAMLHVLNITLSYHIRKSLFLKDFTYIQILQTSPPPPPVSSSNRGSKYLPSTIPSLTLIRFTLASNLARLTQSI